MEQLQTGSKEMDSPPPQEPSQSQSSSASAPQPVEAVPKPSEREKEMLHRTKVIQFLGRTTPIILQNDNGPCPLLAICNVLSLKNSLNLSPDIPEVSQEKLLSLVAERLIDSNSNTENKDTGYVENQQQNISDAIDLLPRLATGIDVNIKFRRIDDFEFTPECAIFDLLDIPLYHGWIVDPQDSEAADAIGSKSYNTLMEELVSLDMQTLENKQKNNPADDVDFVAATTATLGVPSPSLSRGQSFDGSPTKARKGDMEEEEELLRVLKLSKADGSNSLVDGVVADVNFHEIIHVNNSTLTRDLPDTEKNVTEKTVDIGPMISEDMNVLSTQHGDIKSPQVVSHEGQDSSYMQPADEESTNSSAVLSVSDSSTVNGKIPVSSEHGNLPCDDEPRSNDHCPNEFATSSDPDELSNLENGSRDSTGLPKTAAISDSANGQTLNIDGALSPIVDGSEPIYEGEECILDSGTQAFANREPMYEGEVVLAEQVGRGCIDNGGHNNEGVSLEQGEIIRNFLKINASQLTIYGLFCLQDKVKERELCVFFRNNHFNTMFKYEGDLYILATDQGYINQPDLVWEKLNEVNGDTVYMRGNFKEFMMDDNSKNTWDEQNAMGRTADYIASIDSTQADSSFNSDLQLAMALQQQEFEQQQQQQQNPPPRVQQAAPIGGSRLVTGPQVPRRKYTGTSKQQHSKSKEKCIIM